MLHHGGLTNGIVHGTRPAETPLFFRLPSGITADLELMDSG
jgi:hypothetical protein